MPSQAQLLHELQVHQAQLEAQNEELRQARTGLERARDDFLELFDFAPVGYLTVDAGGDVVAVNLTGAALLGVDRAALLGRPSSRLVARADRPRLAAHLAAARRAQASEGCTLRLLGPGGTPFVAQLTTVGRRTPRTDPAGSTTWTAFVDCAERVAAEEALHRSREDLRALNAKLQVVREEAEARIARDLHDDLGQTLTSLQLELRGIEKALEQVRPDAASGALLDRVVRASELASGTLATLRRISQGLHPPVLDHLGLAAALREELRHFEARTGTVAVGRLEADAPPGDPLGVALYRICQEALTNVARHAGAGRVTVSLREAPGALRLEIRDDGSGLPAPTRAARPSLGMLGMQERARALGGEVRFSRVAGGGTLVAVEVPLRG